MTDPKKHDILYQYFWVKVVSKDEVLRRRAAGLQDGPVDNIPLNNPVVIPWLRMISTLSDAKLVVDVLPRNDMKEVKDKDIQVDIRVLYGYDKDKAEKWIETKEGDDWKGEALAFLCHASVELQ